MGGGKSGGKPKQRVVDYFISAHYGLSVEVDEIREIHYGEKRLWSGSVTSNTTLNIDRRSLFGGNKVEGGFRGTIALMLGGASQFAPSRLAQALSRNGAANTADANQLPGFRGICSFFVSGGNGSGRDGANIGSNVASAKPWWVRLRRAPKGAPFSTTINVSGMQLANPAGIIWECLTNAHWGMSAPASLLDSASFSAAATTLAGEQFGLALLWHQQQSIEQFVGVILDHIEGTLALDPFTGRFRLKLIRGDYEVEQLPTFGPHNAVLESFERRAWGETINEVNVVWTNPANEQPETVTIHDTANIGLQGGHIISETREYPGIRTAGLALRVATRDLQAASSALAMAELRVNRSAWHVLPGDVIALEWPLYGFDRLAMRVSNVNYGKPGDSQVRLSLIEDVFALPEQTYVSSDGSAWVNPAIEPVPLSHQALTSAPYYVLAQAVGESEAEAVEETSDIEIGFGTHPASGVRGFEIVEQLPDALGNPVWTPRGGVQPAGRGVLAAPLVRTVSSLVESFADLAQGYTATQGTLVWIGPIDNTGELAQITQVAANGYTLRRGILDTVPKPWPAGTVVWFLPATSLGSTGDERAIGETVTLRYLTNTALGQLDVSAAANVSAQMSGRLHRPYRPAAFAVDGDLFPDPEAVRTYPVTLAWASRNRLEETTLITAWNDAAVTAEAGVTYEIEIDALNAQAGIIQSNFFAQTGISSQSYQLDLDTAVPPSGTIYLDVRLWARRDGLRSWQPATQRLLVFYPPSNLSAVYIPLTAPTDLVAFNFSVEE